MLFVSLGLMITTTGLSQNFSNDLNCELEVCFVYQVHCEEVLPAACPELGPPLIGPDGGTSYTVSECKTIGPGIQDVTFDEILNCASEFCSVTLIAIKVTDNLNSHYFTPNGNSSWPFNDGCIGVYTNPWLIWEPSLNTYVMSTF